MGGSWRERSACGDGEVDRISAVLTIAPLWIRRDTQYGVLAGVLWMMVANVDVIASGGKGARELEGLYHIPQEL